MAQAQNQAVLDDLPDDVREEIEPHMPANQEMLDSISTAIAERRNEAKAARSSSGIEQTWRECEEAYLGIDEANRQEYAGVRWSKPMDLQGPVTTGQQPKGPNYKSTVFVPLTARYVDAGFAKVGEILLPPDDKAFSFSETPVPDLIKAKEDKSQVVHDGMGNVPLMRPLKPGETPPPPAPGPAPAPTNAASLSPLLSAGVPQNPQAQPPQDLRAGLPGQPGAAGPQMVPLTVSDLAEEAIEMARKKAEAAEKRIYDWMVESNYTAEMRKVIFDAARCGVGVLKGPFPKVKRGMAVQKAGPHGLEIQIEDKINPAYAWVDFWNIYPDPACGENIHDGDFIFERDHLSPRQVRELKDVPGYIAAQIDKVLVEGPTTALETNDGEGNGGNEPHAAQRKGRFQVWYYYGTLKRSELSCICSAADKPLSSDDVPEDQQQVYAIVTLINNTVVRAAINPLDSGKFPYHSVPWRRRGGHWAGIGVGEQLRTAQKMLNAATRAMLNNAGKSAGSQFIVDRAQIEPADGNWTITPDKIWNKKPDSPGQDVRQAFMSIDIPNTTAQLMTIINYAMQLAEESTSIPLITQGQSGPTTPDTLGATQIQNNNANQLLRSIGYAFDDYITEPVVRQSYEWLLLDPDVPDDEKGDFQINAHGSAALVERAIQDQTIAQMGPMVVNPAYGFDPKKWAAEFVKSKRMVPENFQYTPEEQAKLDSAPPPVAPVVQAAQIKAASDEKIAQGEQGIDQQKASAEATVDLHELAIRRELALLDYANRRGMNLDAVKAELAQTAMKLQTQEKLNAVDTAADMHRHHNPGAVTKPPVQVPGRAADGQQFSQAG
jgi:hypothetical protein